MDYNRRREYYNQGYSLPTLAPDLSLGNARSGEQSTLICPALDHPSDYHNKLGYLTHMLILTLLTIKTYSLLQQQLVKLDNNSNSLVINSQSGSVIADRSRHYLLIFAIYPSRGHDEKMLGWSYYRIGEVPALNKCTIKSSDQQQTNNR